MKFFLRIMGGLLALILLIAIGLVFYARASLPQTKGRLVFDQLEQRVTVARDKWGVPHVDAQTEHDLHFALGVVHAQDRLWQLDIHRRIATGRLSEVFGEAALNQDIYLRTLSLYQRAEQAFETLPSDIRAMLTAYTDGVNAFASNLKRRLPLEYQILGVEFEPLTPQQSLAWLKVMALDLSYNMGRELARLGLADTLTAEQIEQFYPAYPGSDRPALPDFASLYDGQIPTVPLPGLAAEPPASRGSNNWVVDGQWTQSGLPILANDPHLLLNTPSLWYLVHLRLNGRNLVGVSMPIIPMIVLGRNDTVAWGFTNTGPDSQDLYLEKLTEDGGYLTPDGPARFTERTEVISIKDGEDRTITVRETRHGPVLSDALNSIKPTLGEETVLALRWTALDEDDRSVASLRTLMDVTSFEDFEAALQDYSVPQQNMIYADTQGHIGYYAPARVPVRAAQNTTHGMVPAPGWKAGFDWLGYLDYEQLPRRYDPADGMIVTANQKIVPESYEPFLSHRWSLPYRYNRIVDLLKERRDHDLDTMLAIQMDHYSGPAADLLPLFLDLLDMSDLSASEISVIRALRSWDYIMAANAPEPLIFAAWHKHLIKAVMADELGERFEDLNGHKIAFLMHVLQDQNGMSAWCDDQTSPETETCTPVVVRAFGAAMDELRKTHGPNWQNWRWGDVHRVRMEHRPFSQVSGLKSFFEISDGIGGGAYTVNVARGSFGDDHINRAGAGYRGLFDMADLNRSRYIIATGQSGHPLSKHYKDLFPLWRDGGMIEIPAIMPNASEADILTLMPDAP